jgi:hypothetical protein
LIAFRATDRDGYCFLQFVDGVRVGNAEGAAYVTSLDVAVEAVSKLNFSFSSGFSLGSW